MLSRPAGACDRIPRRQGGQRGLEPHPRQVIGMTSELFEATRKFRVCGASDAELVGCESPASDEPIWVPVGALEAGAALGFRQDDAGGVWLASVTSSRKNADNLARRGGYGRAELWGIRRFQQAADAAIRWASEQRSAEDAVSLAARAIDAYVASRAQRDAETRVAALTAERDAARKAQRTAEARAAEYKLERDSGFLLEPDSFRGFQNFQASI